MSSQGDGIESRPVQLWCDSPSRVSRLLGWLDQNEDGRNIIFSKIPAGPQLGGKTKNKPYWFREAAKAVFSVDEDENVRQQYLVDPERFATSTRNCVRGWGSKYTIFNNRIGSEISNMPLEEITPGTPAFDIIEKHLPYFPMWKRLHIYLRTLPHYNMLYTHRPRQAAQPGQDISSPSPTASTMTACQIEGKQQRGPPETSQDNIEIESTASNQSDGTYQPSSVPDDSEDEISEADPNNYNAKVQSVRGESNPVEHSRSHKKKLEVLLTPKQTPKRKYDVIEDDGSSVFHSRGASSIDPFRPSPSQRERELELTIELKKLENEALEKKTAAEMRRLEFEVAAEDRRRQAEHSDKRAAEKHELMMKMMMVAGMAMGGQSTSIPPST